jgi:hypothetical protein
LKGLFGDSKVDDLESFHHRVIENVFWFDIAMTNVALMHVDHGIEYFSEDDL